MNPRALPGWPPRQQGAVAIEFAFLFGIFFFIFYGIVSFGMAFFLKSAFQHAAAEGAREAASFDLASYALTADYEAAVKAAVRTRVLASLPTLPTKAHNKVIGTGGIAVTVAPGQWVRVRVGYPNYSTDPLIPNLGSLPFVGSMNFMPEDLMAESAVRP